MERSRIGGVGADAVDTATRMETDTSWDVARDLALAQGVYFVASGLWPILHLRSFEAVTGPKPEGWLVKTVGALIAVTGAALVTAAVGCRVARETLVLGAGSAAALGAVDLWYGGVRRRIHPVYLADAVVELGLVSAWGLAWRRSARAGRGDAFAPGGTRRRSLVERSG